MAPILARCKVVSTEPANTYYFLTSYGVYTGEIATETGITAETSDTTAEFDAAPLTSVKELIRQDILSSCDVRVTDPVSNEYYDKVLHLNSEKASTFATGIIGKTWPTGKGAGSPVSDVLYRRRVKSRL